MTPFNEHSCLRRALPAYCLLILIAFNVNTAAANQVVYLDQGTSWTATDRQQYYSQDQGSRLIPAAWLFALKHYDGTPFMADRLSRYGYLPNDSADPKSLPVGFSSNGDAIGMTCAACHTREIIVDDTAYRIDGGPSISDFQSFAADLDQAMEKVIFEPAVFEDFAQSVLGTSEPSNFQKNRLRTELMNWFLPYDTIMKKALPANNPWGPARLDAISMIFNRVTGLDIGSHPDRIIEDNIRPALAPVRYPFIWNAPTQDKTQWPGFAENGTDLLGLSRNLGEVYGVFGEFYPIQSPLRVLGVDYLKNNSANFDGLKSLEKLVKKMGAPKWPWRKGQWTVNQSLAAKGKLIFDSPTKTEAGGCMGCHGQKDGEIRSLQSTWATPLCYVGTDEKQFSLFNWPVKTGVLAGAKIPFLTEPLKAKDELASTVLGFAVRATILQRTQSPTVLDLELKAQTNLAMAENLIGENKLNKLKEITGGLQKYQKKLLGTGLSDLAGAYHDLRYDENAPKPRSYICKDKFTDKNPQIAYESRVLYGIWATAPYLHNGSVPTLAALLEPVNKRPSSFKIGPNYDPGKIGMAQEQDKFDFVYKTTDCSDIHSGNSRCGHEFGTSLTVDEKAALLEYLKIL